MTSIQAAELVIKNGASNKHEIEGALDALLLNDDGFDLWIARDLAMDILFSQEV